MKRLLAGILTAALIAAMGTIPAFAETETITGLNDKEIAVNATYRNGSTNPTTYSEDIVWGEMSFTYERTGENVWNEKNHSYTLSTTGTWTASGNTVKVTNHSNAALAVGFAYANVDGITTVTGTFDITADTLDAGIEGGYATADSVTTVLTLSGALPSSYDTTAKVGTVTVTLGSVQ